MQWSCCTPSAVHYKVQFWHSTSIKFLRNCNIFHWSSHHHLCVVIVQEYGCSLQVHVLGETCYLSLNFIPVCNLIKMWMKSHPTIKSWSYSPNLASTLVLKDQWRWFYVEPNSHELISFGAQFESKLARNSQIFLQIFLNTWEIFKFEFKIKCNLDDLSVHMKLCLLL